MTKQQLKEQSITLIKTAVLSLTGKGIKPTQKKVSLDSEKVSHKPTNSFERLKRRQGSESVSRSILNSIPSLQQFFNK